MFDFPNSPVNGTKATGSGGQVYTYDGTKWVASSGASGGTLTSITAGAGLTGGTITTTGTIALSSPVSLANGGTGATTAGAALTALGAAPLASPTFTGTPNLPTGTVAVTQTVGNNTTAPATTAFVQTAVVPALNNTGRNLLDNASLNVRQRGNGPWSTAASYTFDRWYQGFSAGATMTTSYIVTPAADAAIIGNEMVWSEVQCVFTGTATAGSNCQFVQGIEDTGRTSAQTVIVSFYARCATGTLRLGVNLQQYFGSGGSAAVSVNGQSVTVTTTLARYSLVFTMPSVMGKTFGAGQCTLLQFWLSADATQNTVSGSVGVQSGTIFLTGFQCEFAQPGQTQPTPLEVLCYADDWARCRRYYQNYYSLQGTGYGTAGMTISMSYIIQPMRTTPTVTFSSQSYNNASGVATGNITTFNFDMYATVGATGFARFTTNAALSADL